MSSLFGSIAGGLSSIKEGQAAARMGRAESQYLYGLSNLARAQAAVEASQRERQARRREGDVISGVASSGIALTGSALDVLADVAFEEDLGVALTLNAGEQQYSALRAQAEFANYQGRAGKKSQNRAAGVSFASAAFLGIGTGTTGWGAGGAGGSGVGGSSILTGAGSTSGSFPGNYGSAYGSYA